MPSPDPSRDRSWWSHQITEFLAIVSSYPDEPAALEGAVEHAAAALEAEVGAIVRDGRVLTSLGFPRGRVPEEAVVRAAGESTSASRCTVEVPGAGPCPVLAAPLDGSGFLLVARSHGAFAHEEDGLLRGMARVLTLALSMLGSLAAERQLRLRSEEQAEENARLVAVLRDRQVFRERLAGVQRRLTQRAALQHVLDSITDGVAELLGPAVVGLHVEGDGGPGPAELVSAAGPGPRPSAWPELRDPLGPGPVTTPGAVVAPVYRNGLLAGRLTVIAPERTFAPADRDVVKAFADHASIALNDASAVAGMRRAFDSALHAANHDPLTGLPNRALVLDRLAQALARSRRRGARVVVLFVDLDRFKVVNDSLGHTRGDEALVRISERLVGAVRDEDTVGRLAGDEFVVICEDLDVAGATEVAERVAAAVAEPLDLGGRQAVLTASIGVAHAEPDVRAEDVLRDADVAMYRAKERGRARIERFDSEMRRRMLERIETEAALRAAMGNGQLRLHYQPIACTDDLRVVAVEALVRWEHPGRGLIPPEHFIHLAEESGLILPLGRWVLNEACRQLAAWRASGLDTLKVTVNLSARQFAAPDLVDVVRGALRDAGLPGDALWLEITESVLMEEAASTVHTLRSLKSLGLHLSVDDFGTGYSSLSYLKRFPVDALKIDRSFVDGLGHDPEDEAIVAAVVSLARALNLGVVAEGVERDGQLQRLRRLGCNAVQGYLLSRPLAPARLLEHLTALSPTTVRQPA